MKNVVLMIIKTITQIPNLIVLTRWMINRIKIFPQKIILNKNLKHLLNNNKT